MYERKWVSADGRTLRVGEMDESHVMFAIAKIERGELRGREKWLPRLYMELAARRCPVATPLDLGKLSGEVVAYLLSTRGSANGRDSGPMQALLAALKESKTVKSRSARRVAASSSTRKGTQRSGIRSKKQVLATQTLRRRGGVWTPG